MVVIDSDSGKIVAGPEIHARGFAEDDERVRRPEAAGRGRAEASVREGNTDIYQLQQVVRRTAGRWVNSTHRRRPMIIPVVLEA